MGWWRDEIHRLHQMEPSAQPTVMHSNAPCETRLNVKLGGSIFPLHLLRPPFKEDAFLETFRVKSHPFACDVMWREHNMDRKSMQRCHCSALVDWKSISIHIQLKLAFRLNPFENDFTLMAGRENYAQPA